MLGKFAGLAVLAVVINVVIYAAVLAGGVWIVVYVLRATGVIT